MKYFILSKVYTDECGIKKLKHSLLGFAGDNPLAKACGLSLCTGGTIIHVYSLNAYDTTFMNIIITCSYQILPSCLKIW